jgi:hypothetical protein
VGLPVTLIVDGFNGASSLDLTAWVEVETWNERGDLRIFGVR